MISIPKEFLLSVVRILIHTNAIDIFKSNQNHEKDFYITNHCFDYNSECFLCCIHDKKLVIFMHRHFLFSVA